MSLKIYNTLTRKKEKFRPISGKTVKMYTCGPTVYDFAHIGNFRAYISADVLKRYLLYKGYKVKHVMNITDVGHLTSDSNTGEDKIVKGAKREGLTAWQIAKKYTDAFFIDAKKLNIIKPDIVAKATDHIKEQIDFIKQLEKKGFTYTINDGVYFDTSKLKDYGKLIRLNIEKLRAGARIERVAGKKNDTDFALWKFSPKGKKRDMEWDSPWGKGFPGWHIECSAMSIKYLGKHFDIHTGGIDHIPIHHTNEIAQNEALIGSRTVNHWVHSEFLILGATRMGKSEGNLIKISDLEIEKHSLLAYRLLVLTAHYRDPLHLNTESFAAADITYKRLTSDIQRMIGAKGEGKSRISSFITQAKKDFVKAMDDDLSTPRALSAIFTMLNNANRTTGRMYNKIEGIKLHEFMLDADEVLGLELKNIRVEKIPLRVKKLTKDREKARKEGDFTKADKIRAEIEKLGYKIEDTKSGPAILVNEKN